MRYRLTGSYFQILFKSLVILGLSTAVVLGAILTVTGKVSPWTGRFYSLLDPSYAKNNIPIIASVSEHQPTTWCSFYFDLHLHVFMFPVGLYYCFSKLTDANIFIIMYGITSVYFAVRFSLHIFLFFNLFQCLFFSVFFQPTICYLNGPMFRFS